MADASSSGAFDKKKSHRAPQSGRKADKKKKRDALDKTEASARQRNPRAFAIQAAVRAERRFRRTEDVLARRQRVPVVDQTPLEPPPLVVAVVGPPRVGKTTLLNNLVRHFVKTNVAAPAGPVTVVASKKRRITLIECNNDIYSMIDIAKCADLALLLCDASFGFEMEIFEFLSVCQVHGMPRVMGVLTHLDVIANADKLKRQKKLLKRRLWTEVYAGAKLFYLSGMQHGEYLRQEIKNLARFISVMKPRPAEWRSTHAYVLADRLEDLTPPDSVRRDRAAERTVALYGYVRGAALPHRALVHIAGVGDVQLHEVSALPDPCPAPGAHKKRQLLERERQIYAPFSGVGGVVYDKDAVYIELSGSHSHSRRDQVNSEKRELLDSVAQAKYTLDSQMSSSGFQLFSDGAVIYPDMLQSDAETHSDADSEQSTKDVSTTRTARPWEHQQDSVAPADDSEDFDNKWKERMTERASQAFIERQKSSSNIMKLVYGDAAEDPRPKQTDPSSDDDEVGGLFRKVNNTHAQRDADKGLQDLDECSLFYARGAMGLRDWASQQNRRRIQDCFVTGRRAPHEDATELLRLDDASDGDEDVYGDFEDLETGEKHAAPDTSEENSLIKHDNILEKKLKLKAKFDSEYDNPDEHRIKGDHAHYEKLKEEALRQAELNRAAFASLDEGVRTAVEGFRPGLYVRMLLRHAPAELVDNLDPTYPLLVGALNPAEQNVGFVTCKVRKHRWYDRILKTNDPLIVSLGWRRFQTLPVYSKLEDDFKCRYLKYTPQHVTCNMHFYGPTTPQHSGLLALQPPDPSCSRPGFRVAATGSVAETDKTTRVLKKLKLVGSPFKIYKKTAFIKDMFTSALEVAKFEGARVRTVSGVRGQIKKALNKPEGAFRATFEDKILMSDIVFCRTWFGVDVTRFYAPVSNLLLPAGTKNAWRGMKTLGQLKRERGARGAAGADSLYTPVRREPAVFKPLAIPRALHKALPYRDKPKTESVLRDTGKRVAVVRSAREQAAAGVLRALRATYASKRDAESGAAAARVAKHKRAREQQEWRRLRRQKEIKKKICRHLSKMATKKTHQM